MKWSQIKSDATAGFVTSLFSIPEGMAYAKLAGVNPVFGLYSGIVATIAASLTSSTVLMISTLTSAIALSTASVFHVADIEDARLPTALFTLTFLVGLTMLLIGLLRLGKLVNFVSNAVMTGFIVGASFLILIGELGDLVGITVSGPNKLAHIWHWLQRLPDWHMPTACAGFGSAVFMAVLTQVPRLERLAAVVVLVVGTLMVYFVGDASIETVRDIARVGGAMPYPVLPDFSLAPKLILGALSVALVALIQGAGVSNAMHSPGGTAVDLSKDFIGQGIGNLCGGFFQSMSTGGSLSRSAVSVNAGAVTRWAGVFTGVWLLGLVYVAAAWIEQVPLAVMAGILCVVAVELIYKRLADVRLILRSSTEASVIMLLTFLATLFLHLQWAIFVGAGLSLLFYVYTSATHVHFHQLVRDDKGYYEERPLPVAISSNAVTILEFEGNLFFAEVPTVRDLMPATDQTRDAVLIWRLRGVEDVSSTFLKWLEGLIKHLQKNGNTLYLEGIRPHVLQALNRTHIVELLDEENLFAAQPEIGKALDQAIASARRQLQQQAKGGVHAV